MSASLTSESSSSSKRLLSTFWMVSAISVFAFSGNLHAAWIPALRAGWPMAAFAVRLFWTDTNRRRAHTCTLFCISLAGFQVAITAFFTLCLLLAITWGLKRPVAANHAATVLIRILAGVVITALHGTIGIALALWSHQRVWVNPILPHILDPTLAVKTPVNPHWLNYTTFLMAVSLTLPMLGVIAAILRQPRSPMITAITLAGCPLVALWLVVKAGRIVASSVRECWPVQSIPASSRHSTGDDDKPTVPLVIT